MPVENKIEYTVADARGVKTTITLEVIETVQFDERAVADERGNHTLNEVQCTWKTYLNPNLNAYKDTGNKSGVLALPAEGEFPAISEQAIIFLIQQPRGKLVWTVGGEVQLETPYKTAEVDSYQGPIPEILSIQKIHGIRSYEVVWKVTTWLNQAVKATNRPPVLLSNTWSMTETLNDQYLSVRVTEGRAKFDPSRFPKDRTPDDYRDWILPVAIKGFKRTLSITATSDGSQLLYSVQDVEQRVRLELPGIAKVQIERSADFVCSGIGTQLINTADAALGAGSSIVSGAKELDESVASKRRNKKPLGGAFLGVSGATLGFIKNIGSIMPSVVHGVDVRVWGTRSANINKLTLTALRIANYHLREAALSGLFGSAVFTTYGFHITQNPVDGIVAVSRVISYPPLYEGITISDDTFRNLNNSMIDSNNGITEEPQYTQLPPAGGTINPAQIPSTAIDSSVPPQRAGGSPAGGVTNKRVHSRGYVNAKVFAQALQDMAKGPVAPPLPPKSASTSDPNS